MLNEWNYLQLHGERREIERKLWWYRIYFLLIAMGILLATLLMVVGQVWGAVVVCVVSLICLPLFGKRRNALCRQYIRINESLKKLADMDEEDE